MLPRGLIVLALWADAALLLVAGVALVVAGPLGLLGSPAVVLGVGLALLGLAVVVAALARFLAGSAAGATVIGVIGFMWLHLLALVVAAIAVGHAFLAGSDRTTAAVWALASGAYLATSYGWDRLTESDVDAALDAAEWHPRE